MIDLKYQVISLVAVFLALGIGILLGTTLVERGLITEQKSEIKSLQNTFGEIKDKNRSLNDELGVYKQYVEQTSVYILSGRLAQRTYALIAKKEPDENAIGAIQDAIGTAGGAVPVTITLSGSEMFNSQSVIDGLSAFYGLPPDPGALQSRFFNDLVNQLKGTPDQNWFDTMENLGIIKVRGVLAGPVTGTIILGGIEENDLDKTDVPLIQTFISNGAPVFGVGSSKTADGVMEKYKQLGISTVGNVDSVMGSVAMVLVLEGRGGNYGIDKTAGRLIPEPAF